MIAGIVDQIAPQSRVIIARVADSDGQATAWTLIEGLAFAVTHGAEVANVSLGSPNQVPALRDVMDWCEESHLLVVSGIGNADQGNAYFPAAIRKVVCVTGLNPNNTKAVFSNWDGTSRSAAPATGIVSQWWDGHMGIWSGTSFSAPMVAAAAADCLRRSAGPIALDTLRGAIQSSGKNIDSLNQPYRGELGTLLDIQSLDATLNPHGPRGRLISPAKDSRRGG
jgi:subtilisin family serine protease